MPMVERIEETLDVRFDHPAATHLHRRVTKRFQRGVRTAPAPEAERAVEEVLLVDGLQHHQHCPLQDLVLEGRDADWTCSPVSPFRDVYALDGWRAVRA